MKVEIEAKRPVRVTMDIGELAVLIYAVGQTSKNDRTKFTRNQEELFDEAYRYLSTFLKDNNEFIKN